ncbi:hypothetical protein [Paraburkholderia susongensis]|uniref:hypothetical protein n=1 Tax=Paraburkholderia susongensis TaxID=1515439 RepID=UPI001ABF5FA2|nr:hypothetical protein [Paraburkholderia susongensis]
MKTYTYDEITAATRQIVTDELARAEKEPDNASARHLRGYASGAWLLWLTVTRNEATSDRHREDNKLFKKLLGVPE